MGIDTLLVTGIHREELGFGDRVAALLEQEPIDVLRIPEGISHTRTGTDGLFYYNTRHREIYLQLRQQVKGHYQLLLDLHCGLNEAGRCADIYCRDERMLRCVAERSRHTAMGEQPRLVKILAALPFDTTLWMGASSKNFPRICGIGGGCALGRSIGCWEWQSPQRASYCYGILPYGVADGVGDIGFKWNREVRLRQPCRFAFDIEASQTTGIISQGRSDGCGGPGSLASSSREYQQSRATNRWSRD